MVDAANAPAAGSFGMCFLWRSDKMGPLMLPDELIGATLGNYKVTAKLGQGGMGAVYLAEHPVLGRNAAIKVLLPELCQNTELVERFFHEARTTARLRHPTMVDVFDFGALPDGRAFLVMDYLDGESLESVIGREGALPVHRALRIARQIALGTSVAHGEHIVHRDLKPDNIFLLPAVAGSEEERVKILDFGIAKLGPGFGEAKVTRTGVVMGTPLFMSPEQCRGAREVDHRSDIYSLGCILFAMLAARPPFLSDSAGEIIGLQQHAEPPRLIDIGISVPDAVEGLLARMLSKSPDSRVQTMTEVAEAIDAILLPRPTMVGGQKRISDSTGRPAWTQKLASPAGDLAGETYGPPTARYSQKRALAYVGLGLLATVMVGYLWLGRPPQGPATEDAPAEREGAGPAAVEAPTPPGAAPTPSPQGAPPSTTGAAETAPAASEAPPAATAGSADVRSAAAASAVDAGAPTPSGEAAERTRRRDRPRATRPSTTAPAPRAEATEPAPEKPEAPPEEPQPENKKPYYRGTKLNIDKEVPF